MKAITFAGLEIHIDEAEKYLQIDNSSESALRAAWPLISSNYPGYEIFFVYNSNEAPAGLMNEIGAKQVGNCHEMRLQRKDIPFSLPPNIVEVTEENYDVFAAYHNENMPPHFGWTSKKIKQDMSRWSIFMSQADGQVNGYILTRVRSPDYADIYNIECEDLTTGKLLMTAAVSHAFELGKPEIQFMADVNSPEEEIASALGFEVKGFYLEYKIDLPGTASQG